MFGVWAERGFGGRGISGGNGMNCWEFKKCGREKGGTHAEELGVCPAYPDHGRQCARIYCVGNVHASQAAKLLSCMECDFYKSDYYDRSYTVPNMSA